MLLFYFLFNMVFHIKGDNGNMDVSIIREEYKALGPMSRGEKMTLSLFIVTILILISRTWWKAIFPLIGDETITVAGVVLFMVIPVDWKKGEMLLDIKTAISNFPAPVVLLIGASLTIGNAMAVCGVTDWIAGGLKILEGFSPIVLVLIMAVLTSVLTEVCTNQVVVAAFLPIMYSLSIAIGMNPLILMVAVTVCGSFAYALPSGTPPTAIAMSTGEIELKDMIIYGFLFKLISIAIFVPVFYLITMGIMKLGG